MNRMDAVLEEIYIGTVEGKRGRMRKTGE